MIHERMKAEQETEDAHDAFNISASQMWRIVISQSIKVYISPE